MALNIGSVNFGVDANTAGLRKAIAQLNAFEKRTNAVARSQKQGAQQVAKAFARQESAVKGAFQQVLKLQQAQRKVGAPASDIARVSNAFKRLTKEMTSGKITTIQYTRAMDAFTGKINRSRRALTTFNSAARVNNAGRLTTVLRNLESASVLAIGPLSGLGARIRSLGAIFGRVSLKMTLFIAGIVAVVFAMGKLAASAVTAGQEMKSLILRFEAATGSSKLAREELAFVIKVARQLGLSMAALSRSYARFVASSQGTIIEGEKTRTIFLQIARGAAALKLSVDDTEGVFRALEQIMSKGTVQAEELRSQLGDRLPGAFRIAATAIGVTTVELNRMLKAGEVISEEFVPAFAKAVGEGLGKNAAANLKTLSGQTNLLATNFKILTADIDNTVGISAALTSLVGQLAFLMGKLAGESAFTTTRIAGLGDEMVRTAESGEKIRKLGKTFTDLAKNIDKAEATLKPLEQALARTDRIKASIEFIVDIFKALAKTEKATQDELDELSEKFSFLLGLDIEASMEGIAVAFAEQAKRIRDANEAIERFGRTKNILKGVADQTEFLRARIAALSKGPEAAAVFDKIEAAVRSLDKSMMDINITDVARNKLLAERRALLITLAALERQNADEIRSTREATRKAARATDLIANALERASRQTEILRRRVAAMAKGPESLEIFQKIEAPLLRMEQALRKAGVSGRQLLDVLKEYEVLLEKQAELTDKFARVGDQAARAIVNSFEDIIIKGGKVKDMLKELGRELLRLFLRATFLDQLQAQLGGIFGNAFRGTPAPIPSGGGGGGGFTGLTHGGAFKIPGSGGADRPVTFFGKPGEVATITRADQMRAGGRGGGGDINITIEAPGADAGTIARIKEIVRVEMVPSIIQASSDNTIRRLRRPKFA